MYSSKFFFFYFFTPASPRSRASPPTLFTGIRSILGEVEVISTIDLTPDVTLEALGHHLGSSPRTSWEGLRQDRVLYVSVALDLIFLIYGRAEWK